MGLNTYRLSWSNHTDVKIVKVNPQGMTKNQLASVIVKEAYGETTLGYEPHDLMVDEPSQDSLFSFARITPNDTSGFRALVRDITEAE